MATERRAGAPRLIDWTGERCVPWAPDVQVVYEHYHRYLWAAELVRGRRVLDLGSGEGFGSAILANAAERVVGVDVDETTVEHSRLNYAAPKLVFEQGSALELDRFEDASFGAVVCFELIEHVNDHERVLAGIERVLAEDGLLLISTPDRRVYTDATGVHNPFHAHELTEPELRDLLGERFPHVRLFGQRAVAGSRIAALEPPAAPTARPFALRRDGDDWRQAEEPQAMYLVAVASRAALPALPDDSLLSDYDLRIVGQEAERGAAAEQASAALEEALEQTRTEAARALADATGLADERRMELEETYDRLTALRAELYAAHERRAEDESDLRRMRESVVWNGIQRARGKLYGALGGSDTRRARAVQWTLRTAGRGLDRGTSTTDDAPLAFAPIAFPAFSRPLASLVVTAHTGAETTAACLRSIAELTEGPAFEVIVVDDAADEDNARLWEAVEGATVLVNEPGIGYLRSVNRGAAAARGRYLVLMNNDVEVRPGWLRSLVRRAESAPDVGAVAAKLVYPGGAVQEAGGIIFRDGSACNFGNGGDPGFHEFNYVREVDYGSAACLLVHRDAWQAVGGYDERFAPMYYEDADLCFGLRAHGWRVLYEPAAEVIHHEGATAGTDISSGSKRFQEINRPKLVEKWRTELERDQLPPGRERVRRASNRATGPHVLVIDHRVPMPDHDAGSLRMLRLVETLLSLGCRVTFAPDDMYAHEPYTSDLQQRGVDVLHGSETSIAGEIAVLGDDIRLAILSRPYVAARYTHFLREYAPAATIAYDTVDLHYVRERRRAELGQGHAAAKAETMRELELGLVRGSDVTIVVTDDERRQLEHEAPGSRVVVVPVVNDLAARIPPPDGRRGVLFVGGFEHPPNVDAVVQLVREVMPLVWRQLGDLPVTIAGSKPTDEIEALGSANVEIAGWVEDLQPLLDGSRLLAAPLRFGAGMKGKITQSLGAGLPVVTTPTGAEGLGVEDGCELLVAESAADLAERIVRLHTDDELWRRLSSAGQGVVRRVASLELMRKRLAELLALSAEGGSQGALTRTGC